MSNNREFSQLASYIEVTESNNTIGIATGGTQTVGIASTSITFEGSTGYINAKGFYKDGVEVAPTIGGITELWVNNSAGIHTTENVGIGTTNPTAKLDVDGTVALGSSVYDANGEFGSDGQVLSNVTGFGVSWTNASVAISVAGSDGQIQYNNGGSFGGAAQLYYDDANNRVGINSSAPISTLDVDGTLNVSDVIIENKFETTTDGIKILNGTSETAVISGPQNIILDPSPDDVVAIATGNISGANVTTITGITTTNIALGNLVQEVDGIISTGTTVTSVGTNEVGISKTSLGAASSQEFLFVNQTPTGIVRIKGDLYIDGTRTEINSTTLTIDDLNVVVASGATNGLTADTAGLTVDGANAYLKYNYNAGTNETWELNKNVGIGTDNATAKLDVDGTLNVSGLSTFSNDLHVSGIVSAHSLDAAISEWTLGASGTDHYTFTGPGLTGAENDPSIYLARGQKYRFKNSMGAHPFQIQTVAGSAGIANTYSDGVVGNKVTDGTLTWNVQFDAPDVLYYQCTAHANMGGKIYIGNSGESITAETLKVGTGITASVGIITATKFVTSGGSSSDFIKGDGSTDSNTYLTAESDTIDTVLGRGNSTTKGVQITGVSTLGITTLTNVTAQQLNVSGISTFHNVKVGVDSSIIVSSGVSTADFKVKAYDAELGSLSFEDAVDTTQYFSITKDISTLLFGVNDSSWNTVFSVDPSGNVVISGSITKGSGTFTIPHPIDSSKLLVHSFIEGPRADLIYRGKSQLSNGISTVIMDSHIGIMSGTWEALCRNPQVFLQNNESFALVKATITDNGILTITSNENTNDRIDWMVVAERQDDVIKNAKWTDADGNPILEPNK